MKAYLIDPVAQTVTEVEHDGKLDSIYALLKCKTIDAVHLDDGDAIYLDDEGLLVADPDANGWWNINNHGAYVGRGLVTGTDEDGNDTPPKAGVDDIRKRVRFLARTRFGFIDHARVLS